MTLQSVGSHNKYRLTQTEKEELKLPLSELGLSHTKVLGGAQVVAAFALHVASPIPGEAKRLSEALTRYNQRH